jgi:tetratricopeptide (TPR) repeat protein
MKNEVEIIEQAKKYFSAKQHKKAIELCHKTLDQHANYYRLAIFLSQLYQQNSEFDKMLEVVSKVAEIVPSEIVVQLRKSECLIYAGEISLAISSLDRLYSLAKTNHQLVAKLAELYLHCSQHEKVVSCHQLAIKIQPNNLHYQYNLASGLLTLGKLKQAEKLLNQVIERNPQDFDAYYSRSTLRKQTIECNHIVELKEKLSRYQNQALAKISIGYALSKEYEDIADYPQAFSQLKIAASKRRQKMGYKVSSDLDAMSAIKKAFNRKWAKNSPMSASTESPIFILGLPRSGTTLVERILSSHSKVGSLGEVNNLAFSMIHTVGSSASKMDLIKKSAHLNFDSLASKYSHATRGYGVKGDFLIDKTPLNFLYIGLIKKSFPKAKIIHLTRHPLDSCFAMYKTLFRMGYPFSYEIGDLANYYHGYHQLMAHWREMFKQDIFDLEYSDLVDDSEKKSRELLSHCGLKWESQVLEFYKNKSATATASAAQVRQPIYTSSVNRWTNYRDQLLPLKKQLEEKGINCE